jgi:hypothetical protein
MMNNNNNKTILGTIGNSNNNIPPMKVKED